MLIVGSKVELAKGGGNCGRLPTPAAIGNCATSPQADRLITMANNIAFLKVMAQSLC
jgi:hypothetical protein